MTSASSSSKAPAFVPRLALAQNLSGAANTPQPYSGVVSSPRTQTFQQQHHVVTASSPNLGYSGIIRRSESPRCAIPAGHGAAERIRKLQTLWDDLTNALDRELLGNGHKADRNRPYSVQMRREIKDARVPSAFGRQGKMVVKPELVPRMPLSARGSNGVNRATTVTSSPHKSNVVSASPRRASSARTASTPRPASTSRPSPRNSARSSLSARQSTTPRDSAPNPTAIWTRGVSAGALAEDPRLRHLSPRFTPRPSPRPWKQPVVQPRPPPAGGEEIPHGVGHDYPAKPSRTMNFVLSQRVLSHGDTKRRWRAWHPSLMKTDNLTNAETAAYTHATSGLHQYESLYWAKHSKLDVDKAIADRNRVLKERGEQNIPMLSSTIDDFEDDMTVYEKTDRLRYYVSGVGALLRTANNA